MSNTKKKGDYEYHYEKGKLVQITHVSGAVFHCGEDQGGQITCSITEKNKATVPLKVGDNLYVTHDKDGEPVVSENPQM